MKRTISALAIVALLLAGTAMAAQVTVTQEGVFDSTIRKNINDNFDELYNVVVDGTQALLTLALTITKSISADSATTTNLADVNLTTGIDTTGTNTHQGVNVDLTVGNATGGTNKINAFNLSAVTGDASVDVTGLRIGTGTTLGTSYAIIVGTGWDLGAEFNSPVSITQDLYGDGGDQLYGFLQDQVASTTTSTTAAQCGKTFVSNSADIMTLPEASTVLGCRQTFVCGTADDFDINPADGTDQIGSISTTNGTTAVVTLAPAAGDAIRCTDIGGSITLEAVAADLWVQVEGGNGVWTDVN